METIIPKLHYISKGDSAKEHLQNIQNACTSGAELVQLRVDIPSEKKLLKLAEEAREITAHFQTRLILNGHYKIAKTIKADGVYLEESHVCPTIARKHMHSWQIIGGFAHNLDDCETLISKDVDYISLGPFRVPNDTNDLKKNLGLNGYKSILNELSTQTPIIGFGGITLGDVTEILNTGISGVAVSDAITQDFNTIRTFHELLNASVTKEQRHHF